MTREEVVSLPPALGVKVLLKLLSELHGERAVIDKLTNIDPPKVPRAPKYDMRINRKGGYQWASETDLEGLRFWFKRFTDNANEGGKWAEKDGKKAEKLSYWLSWREACPELVWTGQRNDTVVTAATPSGKPAVHEWEERGQVPLKPRHDEEHGDDEIPF